MSDAVEIITNGEIEVLQDIHGRTSSISRELSREIDEKWLESKKKYGDALYDAQICYFSKMDKKPEKTTLYLECSDYKFFKAQREGIDLNLTPVGVSGALICEENGGLFIIAAKRAKNVEQYKGYIEFVPAGGINKSAISGQNRIFPEKTLLEELEEEVHVRREEIKNTQHIVTVKDKKENVIDICYLLQTSLAPKTVLQRMAASDEYTDPQAIPLANIALFLKKNSQIVPVSRSIAEMLISSEIIKKQV